MNPHAVNPTPNSILVSIALSRFSSVKHTLSLIKPNHLQPISCLVSNCSCLSFHCFFFYVEAVDSLVYGCFIDFSGFGCTGRLSGCCNPSTLKKKK